MAHLTQEECNTINENPLGDSLDAVREALREVERDHPCASAPERSRFVAAIGKLFSILYGSDVSLALASRTGRDSLVSDLIALRIRIHKGDLEYQHYRLLSQLVVKQAQDIDIWTAVVAVVQSLSHLIPPPNLPTPAETPIIHSSASQQESRVLEEIRYCTHRAVEGFHEKYFENHKWNRRAKRVWQRVKSQYSITEKRWTQLPDAATEDQVCRWLLKLQDELLATERAAYFRGNKVGTETSRQLDLFVKMRRNEAADAKHNWEHVLVVGELKQSDQKNKSLWLQVGSAVRNVFAFQPTRSFVHAFTLTGAEMETWVFDRSGPYSGPTFNIHKEPEKFIQVMCGYVMMSHAEMGLDTFTKAKDSRLYVTIPVEARGKKRKRQVELDPKPVARPRAIVGRGTTCFLAKATGAVEFDRVVKYSWTSSMRPPEADLLTKANERGVKGLAKVVGYQEEVTSISKLREGLVFTTAHKFRGVPRNAKSSFSLSPFSQYHSLSQLAGSEHRENEATYPIDVPQGTSLVQLDGDQLPYTNRILRVLAISPAGRSIRQFKTVIELLEGLRDAVKVHQSLYTDGEILHRDISENNIIITNPSNADGFKGMLIDLDLAEEEDKDPSGARHRTGTMEFMAIEVLLGLSHTYRHDLESFFYVLIWLCARRGWELLTSSGQRPEKSFLSRWYTGGYEDIAQNKRGDMDKYGLEFLLRVFPEDFDCVKPLCRAIRDVLFPHKDGALFTGTPQDPKILYDPIIRAFDDTIERIGP
ncbi:serine/threonine-protein kinase Sgk2 [Trichoderma sp. SZMC 28014]